MVLLSPPRQERHAGADVPVAVVVTVEVTVEVAVAAAEVTVVVTVLVEAGRVLVEIVVLGAAEVIPKP
jgi:hypothetical protein